MGFQESSPKLMACLKLIETINPVANLSDQCGGLTISNRKTNRIKERFNTRYGKGNK